MADVVVQQTVILKVTDQEWRLIMKCLAAFVGLKVTNRPEEKDRAAALNKTLLAQRVSVLQEQLKVAVGALERANVESEDPTGAAAESMMAFEVGKTVERANAARERERGE